MHGDMGDLASLVADLQRCLGMPGSRAEHARAAAELVQRHGRFRWVGLYDVTSTEIRAIGWSGPAAPAFPSFPRAQGLNGAAVTAGAPVVANDVARDPRYLTTFATTGAEMIVPVQDDAGRVVGTVDVESDRVGAFGPAEQALVERCAAALRPLWLAAALGR
ncbi:MAG: GAF domain-containing protein [Gemmatimonadaceae bacterium]